MTSKSVFHIASEHNHTKLARFLIEVAGADPHELYYTRTPAYKAGCLDLYFELGYPILEVSCSISNTIADGVILSDFNCQVEIVRGITQASFIFNYCTKQQCLHHPSSADYCCQDLAILLLLHIVLNLAFLSGNL